MSAAKKVMPPDAVCLMGPTASGKTALAIELLSHHPFEIYQRRLGSDL